MVRRTALADQTSSDALDVKRLRTDLALAIERLSARIDRRDPAKNLSQTRDAFARWTMEIDTLVCSDVNGPCGPDMLIGS